MTFRVQQVGGALSVVFSPEAIEALHLSDGAEVEVRSLTEHTAPTGAHRYLSVEEGMASYRRTEPHFHQAFLDLAK